MASSLLPGTLYEERWSPWFMPIIFWFPCTWRYEVVIANGGKDLKFGYGPSCNLMKKAVCLDNICDVTVGTTTWKENLLLFGFWGNLSRQNGRGVVLQCYQRSEGAVHVQGLRQEVSVCDP